MSDKHPILCRNRAVLPGRGPFVFGILNVTPDSFSDGGDHDHRDAAIAAGLQMANDGADAIDIGGESTRPGSEPVSPTVQIDRTRDVIAALARQFGKDGPAISIDTRSSEVAEAALTAGATIVNDVSACQDDPELAAVTARHNAGCILMHMQGSPATMQAEPHYDNVVAEVGAFLADRAKAVEAAGIDSRRIILDPGIGFGKTTDHNLAILKNVEAFAAMGYPIMIGPSRKRFIADVLNIADPKQRDGATAQVVTACILKGVECVRVHNVGLCREAALLAQALRTGSQPS